MTWPLTKSYHQTGTKPQIGDMVQLFDGPFGTGLISAIDENKNTLTANYIRMCLHGPNKEIRHSIESITISLDRLKLEFYTTGPSGKTDNRWFEKVKPQSRI